jgi:hypothetical protein
MPATIRSAALFQSVSGASKPHVASPCGSFWRVKSNAVCRLKLVALSSAGKAVEVAAAELVQCHAFYVTLEQHVLLSSDYTLHGSSVLKMPTMVVLPAQSKTELYHAASSCDCIAALQQQA